MRYILGLSFNYHDSSASLIDEHGDIVSCVDEERFSRVKHDNSFPVMSIKYLINKYSLNSTNLLKIAYYENTIEKERRVARQFANSSFSVFKDRIGSILSRWNSINSPEDQISKYFRIQKSDIHVTSHHFAHACASIYTSGFKEGTFVTLDGVGEITTGSRGYFFTDNQNKIKINVEAKMLFPNSIGLFYTAITQYLGFEVNEGEYKVMGLAPYGAPLYKGLVRMLFKRIDGMNTVLNQKYFCFTSLENSSFSEEFLRLFGFPSRLPEAPWKLRDIHTLKHPVTDSKYFYADFAASCQSVVEEIIVDSCLSTNIFDSNKLVCSGGVFYNSVANGKILDQSGFDDVHIYPAAGDSGNSLGAAFSYLHQINKPLSSSRLKTIYLGRSFTREETIKILDKNHVQYLYLDEEASCEYITDLLLSDKVVAIFNGRAEHGPRALGNRSIIASPVKSSMKEIVNSKIKYREKFRPFAPSVISEMTNEYFDLPTESILHNYMLATCSVKSSVRSKLRATTHIDGSARVQVVYQEQNPFYHLLISCFGQKSGVYALLNTSFNVRGEPIVDSIEDALSTFYRTDIDVLYLNGLILDKNHSSR